MKKYFVLLVLFAVYAVALYSLMISCLHPMHSNVFIIVLWSGVIVIIPFIAILSLKKLLKQKCIRNQNSMLRLFSPYLSPDIQNHSEIDSEMLLNELKEFIRNYVQLKTDLSEKERLLNGFFGAMINGLIVHRGMKIIDVNRAICEMTGYTETEFKNLSVEKVLIPHESLMGDTATDMTELSYRSMCFEKNRHKFPVDIRMTWIQLNNDNLQISVVRDLREKREIEDQLQSERARRIQAMFDGQEMERRRLAKEIHDGLGQSLIAIRLLIEGKIAGSSEVNKEALEKIRSLIDRTIADARLMSNNLMPSVLHEFGFVTALRQLCDHVRQSSRMKVNFDVDCSRFMLSSIQTVYLFRIAQEAVNNILKHSQASEMSVVVKQTDNDVFLTITDNGKGFDESSNNHIDGNGLYNMKERVQLLKGNFELRSCHGKGTELKIVLPNWRLVSNE